MRLIDADALTDFIAAGHLGNPNEPRWSDNEVVDLLKSRPTIEPKRGKWLYKSGRWWEKTWECSECGEETTSAIMGKPRYNYCPICGADMKGEYDG